MGELRILGEKGDVKIEWDPDNDSEVEVAEKFFKENVKKGFKPFRMYDAGKQGAPLEKFDKYAEKILFLPPLGGG